MSLLNRYLDTEKYQGEIRPLPKALFYQRFGKHELWLTDVDADKAGIDVKQLKEQPDAQKAKKGRTEKQFDAAVKKDMAEQARIDKVKKENMAAAKKPKKFSGGGIALRGLGRAFMKSKR